MKFFLPILGCLLFCSCKTTEQNIAGTYRLKGNSQTKLVINRDNTFEFVKNFNEPGPSFFPDSTELNFRTNGYWKLGTNGRLVLNSESNFSPSYNKPFLDSITRNTEITSFSFWDTYGEPIPIRMIRFPANRVKLHKSNIISFFAEDFQHNDTLEFHFYGYPPHRWAHDPNAGLSNSQHRITLFQQDRPGYFKEMVLLAERKKLVAPDKSFTLFK